MTMCLEILWLQNKKWVDRDVLMVLMLPWCN